MSERPHEAAATAPLRRSEWSAFDNLKRILWGLTKPVWVLVPAMRAPLLRCFGGRVGRNVRLARRVAIEIPWKVSLGDEVVIREGVILYSLGTIEIGERVQLDRGVHVCAGSHDHTDPGFPLRTDPIRIGAGSIVGAESFIAPGTTIGEMARVRPRSVVVRSIPAGSVVAGNPARVEGDA